MSTATPTPHRQRRLRRPLIGPVALVLLTLALLVPSVWGSLAIAPPVAHASDHGTLPSRASRQATFKQPRRATTSTRCPCNSGLPGGRASAGVVEASSQTAPSSQCPCNSGLPGGPRVSSRATNSSTPLTQPLTQPGDGFDWTDAGVGAGAMLGIILLMAGLAAGVRTARGAREAAGSA